MNKLSLLAIFLLASCSMEKDTRLICDCEFRVIDNAFKYPGCSSKKNEAEVFDNKLVIFNESKDLLQFDGEVLDPVRTSWFEEFIQYKKNPRFSAEMERRHIVIDKVNLDLIERIQDRESNYLHSISGAKYWVGSTQYLYKCRVENGT